jgi:hypothetical protein
MLAALLASQVGTSYPVLTYSMSSHMVPRAQSTLKTKEEEGELTATLGHHFLIVESKGERTVYDFAQRRIYRVNESSRTYRDLSLYSDIGFREPELRNRLMVGSALAAGKVKGNPFVPAQIEHLLSLTSDHEHTVIDQARSGTDRIFSWRSIELMRVSEKTETLPTDYQAEFWRFLRYTIGGHPQIYAALQGQAGVPQRIEIRLQNVGYETRTLDLKKIEVLPDTPYSLEGFGPAPDDPAEPGGTIALLGGDSRAELLERVAKTLRDRDAALGRGMVLDALLAHFAVGIITGDFDPRWIEGIKQQISSDTAARTLTASLAPQNKQEAENDVKALEALSDPKLPYGYMLAVFKGNVLSQLGAGEKAEQSFLTALRANPYLTGTWHDLGGNYFHEFRMGEAWRCWDTARRLRPDHPMMTPVTETEQRLAAQHPEFF